MLPSSCNIHLDGQQAVGLQGIIYGTYHPAVCSVSSQQDSEQHDDENCVQRTSMVQYSSSTDRIAATYNFPLTSGEAPSLASKQEV